MSEANDDESSVADGIAKLEPTAIETYRSQPSARLRLSPTFGTVTIPNVEALSMATGTIVVDDSGLELRGRRPLDARRFWRLFGYTSLFQLAMLFGFGHFSMSQFWMLAFLAIDSALAMRVRRSFRHSQLCDVVIDRRDGRITLVFASSRRRIFERPLLSLTFEVDGASLDALLERLAQHAPVTVRTKLLSR